MRAAVDVMGGDKAPAAILKGCWEAVPLLAPGDVVLLVGDEKVCKDGLAQSGLTPDQQKFFQIVPTTQVIAMDDSPVDALRSKPDSSIAVQCKMASKGEADVVISAGNTGACVAAAQLRMRTLPGISRPGISVNVPTQHGPVVLCDVGANVAPKIKHYHQYALMASCYSKAVLGVDNPRVGLLSIGEEESKGTSSIKEVNKLLKEEKQINFIGNVEGKDITKGVVDVIVCDGFVGNIVLKLIEGLSEGLFKMIMENLMPLGPAVLAPIQPALQKIKAKHDFEEYGGAPLLGVGGYSIICHGRSGPKAIKNAIRVGKQMVDSKINEAIVEKLQKSIQVSED